MDAECLPTAVGGVPTKRISLVSSSNNLTYLTSARVAVFLNRHFPVRHIAWLDGIREAVEAGGGDTPGSERLPLFLRGLHRQRRIAGVFRGKSIREVARRGHLRAWLPNGGDGS